MSELTRSLAVHLWFRSTQLRGWARIKWLGMLHGIQLQHGTCFRIGSRSEFQFEGRSGIVRIGESVQVSRNCIFWVSNTGVIDIGDGVFINNNCSIFCRSQVTIGANTLLGEGVHIYDHNHKFRRTDILIKDQGYTHGDVEIGSNCWLGTGVTILRGASIGNHCVIGAGCIVSESIPPETLVTAGGPVLKRRIVHLD